MSNFSLQGNTELQSFEQSYGEVISAQVLRGMEKNTQRILDLIGRLPTYLHRVCREYSGVKGTGFYRAMQSGKYPYRMYCFIRD